MMHCRSLARVFSVVIAALLSEQASATDDERTVFIEDAEGTVVYAVDADGREVSLLYDDSGALIATIDENGVVTDWQELFSQASEAGGQ
jgi:YD repeat-containing protein